MSRYQPRVPPEISETAYNIAKVWGCVCTPVVTSFDQDPKRNRLIIKARHAAGCNYNPMRFFRPPEEIDEAAISESAERAKKARQRANRKYPNRRTTS